MEKILPPLSWGLDPRVEIDALPEYLEKLHAAGIRRLSLETTPLKRCAADEAYCQALLSAVERCGLSIRDVHAPHSSMESLGYPVPGKEEAAVKSALATMECASRLGARTVTLHTSRTRLVKNYAPDGVEYPSTDLPQARERILRQLEQLVPMAEKYKIIIAVENLFLPSSTAAMLAEIIPQIDSPFLGYCYDAGHALLLEQQPGKTGHDIQEWIRLGWENDTVTLQPDQLDIMLPHVVTCHLHDNHGIEDEHRLPGEGIADWTSIVERLKKAPRLVSLQTELTHRSYDDVPLEKQISIFAHVGLGVGE